MGLYTYKCQCGHVMDDVLKPYSERNACPVCGRCGRTMMRDIELPAGAAWKTECPTASKGKAPK